MSSNVTLKQIAKELGLSAMTVSRAINNKDNVDEKTRERVLAKAKSMGYTPNHLAKSLVSQKTYTIGVVIPEISHSFFPEVVRGIEEVTYEKNYQLILTHSAEKFEREQSAIETLRSKRVDGIMISCSQTTRNNSFYKNLTNIGVPIVFFDRCIDGIGLSCITVNDKTGAKQITQHLINHGYKKIAHLRGPQGVSIGKKRFEGFKEALSEAHLELDEKLVADTGFQEEGGYEAMKKILELPKEEWPDAVMAVNDPAAFGAIEAIKEAGLSIPDDIAIVGFSDDIRAELLPVPLTTVQQPAYEVGKKAAQKLIRLVEDDEEKHENIEVLTELMIRSSCGCK
ncbi:LacI family DNA-binding transcriptional regulator [Gracilimonas mengyeensis]|uniref:Transcriptional regulator, LacI family n=1 Tax=Gracilimonas mengyeensis TaxID=1302730 RepID=A0A521BSX0_9BACT|nr:LacI family DNA-binding transcriptional regulator [Gracilimonas mengyeensis]SMO50243.1 transcriptional regulator, LacI family [Gracilimonas mengyeensis]